MKSSANSFFTITAAIGKKPAVKHFEAIINPPQGAILAIGSSVQKIISSNGKPLSSDIMSVSLSCDHRVIDGAVGATFLQALRKHVEEPE